MSGDRGPRRTLPLKAYERYGRARDASDYVRASSPSISRTPSVVTAWPPIESWPLRMSSMTTHVTGRTGSPTTVAKVSAGSFVPKPEVDSTVVRITPLPDSKPRVPIADENHYSKVVHAAFGQRRKTLRNALRELLEAGELEQLGIEPGVRGETLSVPEFVRIA